MVLELESVINFFIDCFDIKFDSAFQVVASVINCHWMLANAPCYGAEVACKTLCCGVKVNQEDLVNQCCIMLSADVHVNNNDSQSILEHSVSFAGLRASKSSTISKQNLALLEINCQELTTIFSKKHCLPGAPMINAKTS